MESEFTYFFADVQEHDSLSIVPIGLSLAEEDGVDANYCSVSLRDVSYHDGTFVHTVVVKERVRACVRFFDK